MDTNKKGTGPGLLDTVAIVGIGLIAYGAHQWYPPLGFIVVGVALLAYSVLAALADG